MKIVGIITARGGSKGVPGKNIKTLGDLPLLAYTALAATHSKKIHKTILSTDDDAIIKIGKEYHIDAPFVRPASLATDTTPSIAVIQHAIHFLEEQGEYYDAVCLLQPTSPFREKGFIDHAIQQFIEANTDALVSVLPVPHEYNPHWVFEPYDTNKLKIATGEQEMIKRRQDLPPAFFRDGSIYLTKTTIIKKGSFYGNSLTYIESNPEMYANIDTLTDWQKAESKLSSIKNKLDI